MQDITVVHLDVFTHGYTIHAQADTIVRCATVPTIVEMKFAGENNILRRYSAQCATDSTIEVAVEYLTHLLKTQDWYYDYAEGPAYYAGREAYTRLMQVQRQVEARGVDVATLVNQYCPYGKE